ncbi:proteasome-activating nucleotidase [Candidatus Woesearchaeota archaeon CG10_big_fil_rev_8_21_14_0_10_47_5]|nr:MAG: proteasome-activating nucleotidase [Candidatus Woesearchaeota archaeon CG10_big_fil_rev_8_21_14_0_10_47_5]
MRAEFDRMRRPPLMVCEVREIYDKNAMIRVPNGNQFIVEVSADCNDLKPGDDVIVEQKNLNIIRRINSSKRFNVERFVIMEKPTVGWGDIGGLDEQINEIHEVIELPLKSPELFERVGITPPKGILLYGAPGTGKTLLAKAVAASTNSTFIEIVASELVQKFIGEGAKLVNEIFDLAKEKTPSIIFIDELDALAANRIDLGTSGEREVQRTFMQLLAEIDGFKHLGNVKVIGCTNRKDILDPAILRPGRLDRLIYVPIPDARARREIFRIHTSRMTLSRVNVEAMIRRMEEFSGAEIHAACTEAGYFAIRAGRVKVTSSDFVKAIEKVKRMDEEESGYTDMFG